MSAVAYSRLDPPQSPALRSFEAQWQSRTRDSLHAWREPAMQRFLGLGLPTTRDESWRYTNLRRLAAQSFLESSEAAALRAATRATALRDGALRIAIVNGYPQLAGVAAIDGIEISSLRDMARLDPGALGGYLQTTSDTDAQRWALLNTALFVDGLFIKVRSRVTTPLVLVHTTEGAAGTASHPLIIVEASRGSTATIIEQFADTAATSSLCNAVTHLHLDTDAEIEHYRIFATSPDASHIDTLNIRQQARSRCKQFTITQGGGLVRTNLASDLLGEHARLDSFALLVGHGARHVDCHNVARHAVPHTQSRQTARSIASGTSRVIFNSKVVVESGASHSESRQSSRGLLLSPEAEIDTRPQLEIHTDEVKCAHGATTGRLDPNMLFYMLSRGIDRATAQSLLVYAFLADVLTDMASAETRADVETGLIAQLPDSQLLQEFR